MADTIHQYKLIAPRDQRFSWERDLAVRTGGESPFSDQLTTYRQELPPQRSLHGWPVASDGGALLHGVRPYGESGRPCTLRLAYVTSGYIYIVNVVGSIGWQAPEVTDAVEVRQ